MKCLLTPECRTMENIFVDLIRLNVQAKSPIQTILYQFKWDMALWKRHKCHQYMQWTWWQAVAAQQTRLGLLGSGICGALYSNFFHPLLSELLFKVIFSCLNIIFIVWQVSSHLSCDNTCWIWTWFKGSFRLFCTLKTFLIEQNFSYLVCKIGIYNL